MSAKTERPGAIIVGAGLMGRWHAHACSRAGGRVVAVVDPDPEAAGELVARVGGRSFRDLGHALEATSGEAPFVHVCSPLESHEDLASAAIGNGRHVLLEKPITQDAAAAERLFREASERGVHLVPVHQFLFQPGMLRILATMDRWGPVQHVVGVACSAGAEGEGPAGRARIARDIVPHFFSIVGRVRPGILTGADWHAREPMPGELHVTLSTGELLATLILSLGGRPTRNIVEFLGQNGSAHADLFHGYATFEPPQVSRARKVVRPFAVAGRNLARAAMNLAGRSLRREPAYPGLRELVKRFYRSALSGSAPPILPAEALDVVRARDRAVELLDGG